MAAATAAAAAALFDVGFVTWQCFECQNPFIVRASRDFNFKTSEALKLFLKNPMAAGTEERAAAFWKELRRL